MAWGYLNTHSLTGDAAMVTDSRQDPPCAAEKSSSLPGLGQGEHSGGCPATWAHFQEGVEASSKEEAWRQLEQKIPGLGRGS